MPRPVPKSKPKPGPALSSESPDQPARIVAKEAARTGAAFVPLVECKGVVVLVNNQSKFVVADFSFHVLPQPGQRLGVYRGDQRVGEVRATSLRQGSLVAADIISGQAEMNDEIRAE
ncbi:MAG: hypothetical protein N3G20_05275 [Verrucomicrobiae bacterium]|nr:hypothetical protein [Verrucomicrobiae bacterium]